MWPNPAKLWPDMIRSCPNATRFFRTQADTRSNQATDWVPPAKTCNPNALHLLDRAQNSSVLFLRPNTEAMLGDLGRIGFGVGLVWGRSGVHVLSVGRPLPRNPGFPLVAHLGATCGRPQVGPDSTHGRAIERPSDRQSTNDRSLVRKRPSSAAPAAALSRASLRQRPIPSQSQLIAPSVGLGPNGVGPCARNRPPDRHACGALQGRRVGELPVELPGRGGQPRRPAAVPDALVLHLVEGSGRLRRGRRGLPRVQVLRGRGEDVLREELGLGELPDHVRSRRDQPIGLGGSNRCVLGV